MRQFRIKWAWVQVGKYEDRLMCIAERPLRFLGVHLFWSTIGEWRDTQRQAERDIKEYCERKRRVPDPIYLSEQDVGMIEW